MHNDKLRTLSAVRITALHLKIGAMHATILTIGVSGPEIDFNLRGYTQDDLHLWFDAVEMAFEEMQIVLTPVELAVIKE